MIKTESEVEKTSRARHTSLKWYKVCDITSLWGTRCYWVAFRKRVYGDSQITISSIFANGT